MWIQTYTGKKFNPLIPFASVIEIGDIMQSLRHTCRFNGHTIYFYSVLQHCRYVSELVRKAGGTAEEQLWGLLHDAAEAYISDVPSPIKKVLFGYEEIESRILEEVAKKFGICYPIPNIVMQMDLLMLTIEKRDILPVNIEWEERLPKIPEDCELKVVYESFSESFVRYDGLFKVLMEHLANNR